jgi:hypothetical protein
MKYYLVTEDSIISIDQCDVLVRFPFVHPDEGDLDGAHEDDLEIWHSLAKGDAFVVAANDVAEAMSLSRKNKGSNRTLENIYCMKCDCHHRALTSAEC